jgi:hypothetical protein
MLAALATLFDVSAAGPGSERLAPVHQVFEAIRLGSAAAELDEVLAIVRRG